MQYTKIFEEQLKSTVADGMRPDGMPIIVASAGLAVPGQQLGEAQSVDTFEKVQLAAQLHLHVDGPLAAQNPYTGLYFVGKLVDGVVVGCDAPSRHAKIIVPQGVLTGSTVTANYFFLDPRGDPCPPEDGNEWVYELRQSTSAQAALDSQCFLIRTNRLCGQGYRGLLSEYGSGLLSASR